MTKLDGVYCCKICGSNFKTVEAGFGTLVCCGNLLWLLLELGSRVYPLRIKVAVGLPNFPLSLSRRQT